LITRKSQNSILFLTTLGVYLGLVLVGATPHVRAQGTKSQQEYFDRLKRDNTKALDCPTDDRYLFVPQLLGLIRELDSLRKQGAFDWNKTLDLRIEGLSFCESDNSTAFLGSGVSSQLVSDLFDRFSIELGREVLKRRAVFGVNDIHTASVDLTLALDHDGFSLTTKTNAHDNSDLSVYAPTVIAYFDRFRSAPTGSPQNIIYHSTAVSVTDEHLTVTTRLPRGSLNSLLATDAK
jgi:hypothetical protein